VASLAARLLFSCWPDRHRTR